MNDIVNKVVEWAVARNLVSKTDEPAGTDPMRQFGKLLEETEELHEAIIDSMDCDGERTFRPTNDVVDAIGDCAVVLIIIAAQYGLTLEYCLGQAYDEIKDRKGKLVNGVFVKEQDSPKGA